MRFKYFARIQNFSSKISRQLTSCHGGNTINNSQFGNGNSFCHLQNRKKKTNKRRIKGLNVNFGG